MARGREFQIVGALSDDVTTVAHRTTLKEL